MCVTLPWLDGHRLVTFQGWKDAFDDPASDLALGAGTPLVLTLTGSTHALQGLGSALLQGRFSEGDSGNYTCWFGSAFREHGQQRSSTGQGWTLSRCLESWCLL